MLARAAGLPARIVTGYQGGELNPLSDRLVVRHKVSIIQLLPEAYEARIEQIDGVDSFVFAFSSPAMSVSMVMNHSPTLSRRS